MPYISTSIIIQLLAVIVPQLEQLKEGDAGQRKDQSVYTLRNFDIGIFQAFRRFKMLAHLELP